MKLFTGSPKHYLILIPLIAGLCFMTACTNGGDTVDDGNIEIAVVPKGTAHVFWQSVHAGAKTAAQELGVTIHWNGPQTETMKEQQISIVEDFMVRQVDGIVLAPQDQDALVPVINRAASNNIPVVIFDSGVNTESIVSFVATDNYQGGVHAAHKLAELLNNEGTVIITKVDPGSDSTLQREKGFEDTLQENYPNITILASQYGYSDRERSRAVTEDMLSAHPDVDAVFGPNESSTFGALLALRSRGVAQEKVFVGFDSSSELVEAMRQNEINALVLQNPFNMGYQSVVTMVKHLNGEEIEARVDTGVYVITPENMDEEENQALLSPDLSILNQ